MAVKKHELVGQKEKKVNLLALIQYVKEINEQQFFTTSVDLIRDCVRLLKCLAFANLPAEVNNQQGLCNLLLPVQTFLQRAVDLVTHESRQVLIIALIERFYSLISDPLIPASPVMRVVINVLSEDIDSASATGIWILNQGSGRGPPQDNEIRAALSCLYRWLCEKTCTYKVADWVLGFIKSLQETHHVDILIEISIENMDQLFGVMIDSSEPMEAAGPVILHVLASMRELEVTLEKISATTCQMLENLASDSKQWTRQMLQDLVDIITYMMNHNFRCQFKDRKPDPQEKELFMKKYADVCKCLESHMASSGSKYLNLQPWRRKSEVTESLTTPILQQKKVGLTNLGNTCYLNSVLQALLLTRSFSNHAIRNMSSVPFWSKMSILFAKLMYSASPKLNPADFFNIITTPFFNRCQQQDCSEFLVHLLELLQRNENSTVAPEVAEIPCNLAALRVRNCTMGRRSTSDTLASSNIAILPHASSSSCEGSSKGLKRQSSCSMEEDIPLKSRSRVEVGDIKGMSFVQNIFGGVLLTQIECITCQSSSLSRDIFRDLQLAFPEKPVDGKYSVQSLLNYYCTTEILSGDNSYSCNECGGLRDAKRSVVIESPPKYLILVLKHFKFDPKLLRQTKLMHTVHYDDKISLPTLASEGEHSSYQVYAAIIHQGISMVSGHYYTLAKDKDEWHTYNDEVVVPCTEEELNRLNCSHTPYILFYRRIDIEESPVPTIDELPSRIMEAVQSHNKPYVN